MNKISSVVFDLDGTLMKSDTTIYKSTMKTLKDFNILTEIPEMEFMHKIGYHFRKIFDDFGIDVGDLEYFIDKYKTYYFDYIEETVLYNSVIETLEFLNENNIIVSLLTTKLQEQADKIIEYFKIDKYFTIIMGRRDGIPIKPAPDSLISICKNTHILPENTLMVGDSELDIQCGKNAGALTCAVTYGFRTKEMLIKENPDFLISDMKDLVEIIKQQGNR